MNNKGFTLTEVLVTLVVVALLFSVVIYFIRGTLAATSDELDTIVDSQVFSAAENYILETNKKFTDDYTCILVKELIDYGYLNNNASGSKYIKVTRNNLTKTIENMEYVDICN